MGVGADLYMYDVVVKSSRSLSHLLMSSCYSTDGSIVGATDWPLKTAWYRHKRNDLSHGRADEGRRLAIIVTLRPEQTDLTLTKRCAGSNVILLHFA